MEELHLREGEELTKSHTTHFGVVWGLRVFLTPKLMFYYISFCCGYQQKVEKEYRFGVTFGGS